MTLLPETGYMPTAEDRASLDAWFAAYDGHSAKRDVERMADLAVFPLNLVSDDSAGDGRAAQWDREQFVRTMTQVMGDGGEDIAFESTRTPVFLSPAMAVVFTDSVMTAGGETRRLRYADVLIRRGGAWAFQTMIQGGWGDNL
ncbi:MULTISPECIES: nuclear transport factor 2 family protein [Streptomyces]|uniref:nuclear transport factor 2 family protein n=1 Tax=Streptomyces TaxID=1883 RepID=UPI001E3E5BC6|nr:MULTISPECIES: nuclear transport factor 2 family protein [Streptomyces]UFQ18041.1 nuclear transport factor 2 family protein [Streptomyces huasconensis]WCL87652.1 nuclear transport factor 2 family protein [Streptomyces sp. JCM 35825]